MNHQTTEPLRDAIAKLAGQVERENARHRHRMDFLAYLSNEVQRCVAHFLKTGVFTFRGEDADQLGQEGVKLLGILQDVARAAGRPYIRAERYLNRIALKVPNTKRLRPVVAPLLLVAQTVDTERQPLHRLDDGVWLSEAPGTWEFVFVGAKYFEVFNSWLERCHTDPVNRIILKL